MKYSFIVPVYNCEDCLSYCVDTLLQVKDSEILLIDDGSTDKSGIICDEYAKNNKNIIVFHQKNSGPSVARNKGILESHGEYICFVDSDDFISSEVFKKITKILDEYHVDLIITKMRLYDDTKKIWAGFVDGGLSKENITLKSQDIVLKELAMLKITPSPCRYVIKSSIIKDNNILFTEGIQHEDTLWYPQLLCNCYSFYYVDTPFYNIRMRQGSRGKLNHEKRRKSMMYIIDTLNNYAKDKNEMQKMFIYQNINVDLNFLMLEYTNMSKDEKNNLKTWFKDNKLLLSKIVVNDKIRKLFSSVFGYYKGYIICAQITRTKVKIVDNINEIKGKLGGKDEL